MTDRAFCFCLVLAILIVSDAVISPDDSEGVVLAKVMETAKEIRSGDKKRVKTGVKTPINRRTGWVPGGSMVCWRMLAFLGPEMQGGRETPPGLAVLSVVARSPG